MGATDIAAMAFIHKVGGSGAARNVPGLQPITLFNIVPEVPLTFQKSFAAVRTEAARLGTVPYLLSVGVDGRPHAIAITLSWQADTLSLSAGRKSLANIAARPLVSVMWPAPDAASYGLFVDGRAEVHGTEVVVTPSRAVLHRSGAATTPGASSCGSDCVPLFG